MTKFNLLFSTALALAIFCSSNTQAQTKIWGVGTSVGVAEAEFQNPFIQDTIGPYSPTAWTALTISEKWGRVTGGASHAFWTRSTLGHSRGFYSNPPYYNPVPLPSPSLSNGIAIFDSDFMDNDSTASVGVGSSPAQHRGELISPRIDLTGYTDSALVVKFFSQYVANRNNTRELSVSMSTDDGATWNTPVDYRVLQVEDVAGFVSVPMPTVTAGVSNLTQCRIRFVFDSYYFYASIDDISIEIAPDYDIAIGNSRTVNTILDRGDIVRIGGHQYFPLSNVDPTDLKQWFWGAKLINFGVKTLYPSDNARMYVSIDFYENGTGTLIPNVYSDTMNIDTLEAGNYSGVIKIEYLKNVDFILNNGAGEYRVKYWVDHNHLDASSDNDTARHSFTITDKNESYLSKAGLYSRDNRVDYSRRYFPGRGNYTLFEWGSTYYFPKGSTNNIIIDSIDFRYFIPSSYVGPDSQTLFVNIYLVNDGSGSTSADGYLSTDELTLVGQSYVPLSNLTAMASNSYGIGTAKQFFEPNGSTLGKLNDNGMYYITIQQTAASGGGSSFNYNTGVSLAGEYRNYTLNRTMGVPGSFVNHPSRVTQAEVGQSERSYGWGYGLDNVPSIGIHFTPDSTVTTVPRMNDNGHNTLNVSPNPTSKNITVTIDLDVPTDVQYTLTDAMGRVIQIVNSKQVTQETQTINLEDLPNGVYFLTAKTDQKTLTQRVVKQ